MPCCIGRATRRPDRDRQGAVLPIGGLGVRPDVADTATDAVDDASVESGSLLGRYRRARLLLGSPDSLVPPAITGTFNPAPYVEPSTAKPEASGNVGAMAVNALRRVDFQP